jgi:diadenosine tetraphosphate (Ap4A) HIT family hydrolase
MFLTIPGITDPATLACIARSRKYKQYKKSVEDALAHRCPFCELDTSYNKVIPGIPSGVLTAWHCNPPEKHTRCHFIISPIRHVTDTLLFSEEEWSDVRRVTSFLSLKFAFGFRGILIRDGDATLSAGTVQHSHIHLMVPDGTGRVESPFCKTPEEEMEGVARAIIFEKIRQGWPPEQLSRYELTLIEGRL